MVVSSLGDGVESEIWFGKWHVGSDSQRLRVIRCSFLAFTPDHWPLFSALGWLVRLRLGSFIMFLFVSDRMVSCSGTVKQKSASVVAYE